MPPQRCTANAAVCVKACKEACEPKHEDTHENDRHHDNKVDLARRHDLVRPCLGRMPPPYIDLRPALLSKCMFCICYTHTHTPGNPAEVLASTRATLPTQLVWQQRWIQEGSAQEHEGKHNGAANKNANGNPGAIVATVDMPRQQATTTTPSSTSIWLRRVGRAKLRRTPSSTALPTVTHRSARCRPQIVCVMISSAAMAPQSEHRQEDAACYRNAIDIQELLLRRRVLALAVAHEGVGLHGVYSALCNSNFCVISYAIVDFAPPGPSLR